MSRTSTETSKVFLPHHLAELVDQKMSPNLKSVHHGLVQYGNILEIGKPHRLIPYLAQIGHESGDFRWDRELWGPSAAQKRYDTRTDLGNTPEKDGDGFKYRGRGPIQVTGKLNYALFSNWCKLEISQDAPDFVKDPDKVNTDPWEGLSPLWYWEVTNLNGCCDKGHFKRLTRRINGGYNGLSDRERRYRVLALRYLGYGNDRDEIKRFQTDAGFTGRDVDGISGPMTQAALHEKLLKASPRSFTAFDLEGYLHA